MAIMKSSSTYVNDAPNALHGCQIIQVYMTKGIPSSRLYIYTVLAMVIASNLALECWGPLCSPFARPVQSFKLHRMRPLTPKSHIFHRPQRQLLTVTPIFNSR